MSDLADILEQDESTVLVLDCNRDLTLEELVKAWGTSRQHRRAIFRFAVAAGMTYREIAHIVGLSVSVVHQVTGPSPRPPARKQTVRQALAALEVGVHA